MATPDHHHPIVIYWMCIMAEHSIPRIVFGPAPCLMIKKIEIRAARSPDTSLTPRFLRLRETKYVGKSFSVVVYAGTHAIRRNKSDIPPKVLCSSSPSPSRSHRRFCHRGNRIADESSRVQNQFANFEPDEVLPSSFCEKLPSKPLASSPQGSHDGNLGTLIHKKANLVLDIFYENAHRTQYGDLTKLYMLPNMYLHTESNRYKSEHPAFDMIGKAFSFRALYLEKPPNPSKVTWTRSLNFNRAKSVIPLQNRSALYAAFPTEAAATTTREDILEATKIFRQTSKSPSTLASQRRSR
ncbi:hypothetical protein PSHT_12942 [Puccinia striiformis]|uniref:Uncharacterized protein n=1 Tax=Puccinia striiformis TaxID=27350 RepID=A0A2S4UTG2_9BASI|nr:hypothetical protein PSHT_12942 [Puccinia striiformis]